MKFGFRIVVGLDQSIFRVGHGLESRRQIADSLMMVTVHVQRFPAVPFLQGASGDDRNRVPVGIVVGEIDVLQAGLLFFLHIAVQRAPADDVEQLRAAANAKNRKLLPQRVADQPDFNFVLQGMRFFEVRVIFARRPCNASARCPRLPRAEGLSCPPCSRGGKRARLRPRGP